MIDKEVWKIENKIMGEINELKSQITRIIDVTEHAKIVRKELKRRFPHIKFKVKSARFSGGSSVTVYHCEENNLPEDQWREIQEFVNIFDGFRSDLCDGRYNVGFEYNGERLQGALFCTYNHKWYGK